jgi:hypothetical protein
VSYDYNDENIFIYNPTNSELELFNLSPEAIENYNSSNSEIKKLLDLHSLFSKRGDFYNCERIIDKLREFTAISCGNEL